MDKVKIRDTNSVFDGMSGTVESEDGDKVTVMVDFKAGRKVRNTFNKSCISGLDEDIIGVDKASDKFVGNKSYMDKVKADFERYPEITDFKFEQDVSPDRGSLIWYKDSYILSFTFKNRMRVHIYIGGADSCVYIPNPDGEEEYYCASNAAELEHVGIFTDKDLRDATKDDNSSFDDDWTYAALDVDLLDKKGKTVISGIYAGDYGLDDLYALMEVCNPKVVINYTDELLKAAKEDYTGWANLWKEENVNEDIEEDDPENNDADYLSKEEKCKLALSDYLEVGADKIEYDREDDGGYVFEVSDEIDGEYSGSIWWVFMSYNDAYDAAYERYKDYIEYDADLVDYFGYDTLLDYIDDDAFDDQMDTYYSDYVWYDMDQEEIIEECESRGILDPDDKEVKVTKYRVLDGGEDVYEDDFETEEDAQEAAESYNANEDLAEDGPFTVEEYEAELSDDEATYTEEALDKAKDELVEAMKNEWDCSLDWYRDTYGDDDLRDELRNGYVNVDLDRLIDDYFSDDEIVYQLAWYDNEEQYIEVDWLNQDFYLYRRE